MLNLFRLTPDLAEAIIDMDDHGFSESLGPGTEEAGVAWRKLVMAAEQRVGRESNSTAHRKYWEPRRTITPEVEPDGRED